MTVVRTAVAPLSTPAAKTLDAESHRQRARKTFDRMLAPVLSEELNAFRKDGKDLFGAKGEVVFLHAIFHEELGKYQVFLNYRFRDPSTPPEPTDVTDPFRVGPLAYVWTPSEFAAVERGEPDAIQAFRNEARADFTRIQEEVNALKAQRAERDGAADVQDFA